jgi:hypothetical protein
MPSDPYSEPEEDELRVCSVWFSAAHKGADINNDVAKKINIILFMINFLSAQNFHSPGSWIFDAKAT